MDSFELNKLIGGFLATVFVVFSLSLISDAIFAAPIPEKPGYMVEAAEDEGGGEAGAPAVESVLPLLAGANIDNGKAQEKKCSACHTIDNGGANKTGPNLWNIVNRPIASHEGFAYSAAMKDFSQGGSVKWDYEHLDKYLTSPKALVKGTAMGFAGIKKTQDRADLIAFLRTLSDSPAPLPDAAAAAPAPEGAAAPAGEKPAAAPAGGAEKPAEGAAPVEKPADGAAPAEKPAEGAAPAAPAPANPAPAAPAPAAPAPAAPAPAAPATPPAAPNSGG